MISSSELALDQIPNISHVLQGRGLLVWQLNIEGLLQCHDCLNNVQGVCTKLCERCRTDNFLFVYSQLFRDNLRKLAHGLRRGRILSHCSCTVGACAQSLRSCTSSESLSTEELKCSGREDHKQHDGQEGSTGTHHF